MHLLYVGPCLVLRNVRKVVSRPVESYVDVHLVGSMSCITTYRFIFTASFILHSCKLVHILSQSVDG